MKAEKDVDKMSQYELRAEVRTWRKLIEVSAGLKCPNCDDEGFTVEPDGGGEAQQIQCEFCYTVPDSVFIRSQGPSVPFDDEPPIKHEFVFTVAGRVKSPQMCYREAMPHTAMDRWVRCHLIDYRLVLGPPK